ncbi:hypothetical protein [Anabaena sp. UHCC 0253]|uniref:hypothetical protein n=1 Tax=Anabaena sp. UHCC 0253 TaxID=2590019 RepID=UPI001447FD47|nr:hypothetical protein [Anabaena sp. UHCC 0253]
MRLINEKVKTPGERGNQEKYQCRRNRNCDRRTGCNGRNGERQSVTSNRDDRTGGTSSGDVITAITGGILEQLILESKDELTNSEARVNQLHDRIKLLESLKASLDI